MLARGANRRKVQVVNPSMMSEWESVEKFVVSQASGLPCSDQICEILTVVSDHLSCLQNCSEGARQHGDRCFLKALPCQLVGHLFPDTRVILGLRTCKWMNQLLHSHASSILHRVNAGRYCKLQTVREIVDGFSKFKNSKVRLEVADVLDIGLLLSGLLSSGMRQCPIQNLGSFHIERIHFGWRSAQQLADILKDCKRLEKLGIEDCSVPGTKGAEVIAASLAQCTSLSHLSLARCDGASRHQHLWISVGATLATFSALDTLRSLNVSSSLESLFVAGGVAQIGSLLEKCVCLTHLDVSGNRIVRVGDSEDTSFVTFSRGLRSCTTLRDLRMGSCGITNSAALTLAKVMKEMGALRRLDVHRNSIGLSGASKLCQALSQCTEVYLRDNRLLGAFSVNPCWLTALGNSGALSRLDLENCGVGDFGMRGLVHALKNSQDLSWLNLARNGISGEGGSAVIDILNGCTLMTHLDLGLNHVGGDWALKLVACAVMVPKTPLQHLDLRFNDVAQSGSTNYFTSRAAMVSKHRSIDLLRSMRTPFSINAIGNQAELDSCSFSHWAVEPRSDQHSGLRFLNMRGNRCGDARASRLATILRNCKSIVCLDLGLNDLGSDGARAVADSLSGCRELAELDLGFNEIGPQAAGSISKLLGTFTQLTKLIVRNNKLEAGGAARLARAMPAQGQALRYADFSYNSIGVSAGKLLGLIQRYAAVSYLDLRGNKIDAKLAGKVVDGLKSCNVRFLNLGSNRIGDQGAAMIANALPQCTTLTSLDLSFCSIAKDGAEKLIACIKNHQGLTYLSLLCNPIIYRDQKPVSVIEQHLAACKGRCKIILD